ncbi:MAG: hypothetical protein ACREQK_13230 [Candidatus Binatia bacterium]
MRWSWQPPTSVRRRCNIRTIGPSTTILATDLGQSHNPHVDEGLALFIGKVLEAGVDERDVEKMVRHNPAQMLG